MASQVKPEISQYIHACMLCQHSSKVVSSGDLQQSNLDQAQICMSAGSLPLTKVSLSARYIGATGSSVHT